jgi:regulator of sirC expression with transglutaminase-like and TPR domain
MERTCFSLARAAGFGSFMLLVLFQLGACQSKTKEAAWHSELADKLMVVSEEARTGLGADIPGPQDVAAGLGDLIELARQRVGSQTGDRAVEILNQVIFEESGFVREIENDDIRLMLLPYVIEQRRGSCLGLAGLYLTLARELKLPIKGVLVPNHFFLRLEKAGAYTNIELLRKGQQMPDDWYRQKWHVPKKGSAYLRFLSDTETLAVFLFNLGNAYRQRRLNAKAIGHYRKVNALFEDFAEAHANLGLVYQTQADYQQAKLAYQNAAELYPDLPGLVDNQAALKQKLSEKSSAPAPHTQQEQKTQQPD